MYAFFAFSSSYRVIFVPFKSFRFFKFNLYLKLEILFFCYLRIKSSKCKHLKRVLWYYQKSPQKWFVDVGFFLFFGEMCYGII